MDLERRSSRPFDHVSDRFLLMSTSQCRSVSDVQDLFHIARCKSGIVPVLHTETPESYGDFMTDSASRVKSGFHERRGDPFSYSVGQRYSRQKACSSPTRHQSHDLVRRLRTHDITTTSVSRS